MKKLHTPGNRKPITKKGAERLKKFRSLLASRDLTLTQMVESMMSAGILVGTKQANSRTLYMFIKDWVAREREPTSVPQGEMARKMFLHLKEVFKINILELEDFNQKP